MRYRYAMMTPALRRANEKLRQKRLDAGLVQVAVWISKEALNELDRRAAGSNRSAIINEMLIEASGDEEECACLAAQP